MAGCQQGGGVPEQPVGIRLTNSYQHHGAPVLFSAPVTSQGLTGVCGGANYATSLVCKCGGAPERVRSWAAMGVTCVAQRRMSNLNCSVLPCMSSCTVAEGRSSAKHPCVAALQGVIRQLVDWEFPQSRCFSLSGCSHEG